MGVRHPFGGNIADYVLGDSGGLVLVSGVQITFWTAQVGGSQIVDLSLDVDGVSPVTFTTTADGTGGTSEGSVLTVYGPVDVLNMWAQAGSSGPRLMMLAQDAGDILSTAIATLAGLSNAFSAHANAVNPHGVGSGDLVDALFGDPDSRGDFDLATWRTTDKKWHNLPSSVAAGAILLNPPLVGGQYHSQVITEPPAGSGNNAPAWLYGQRSYSAGDNNPNLIELKALWSDLSTLIRTWWINGNNEMRGAPSRGDRIGGRFFEFRQSLGASTGRFFELSTDPTDSTLREPLLGAYGTGNTAGKAGWIEATRILSALLGIAVGGGSYNSMTRIIFRGLFTGTGHPVTGTWGTGDVVIDGNGTLWLCTAGDSSGGTWIGGGGGGGGGVGPTRSPGPWVDVTPGPGMAHGAVHCSTRIESDGATVRIRGQLTGTATSGSLIGTINPAHVPGPDPINAGIRFSGGGALLTVTTGGLMSLGVGITAQTVYVDTLTYPLGTAPDTPTLLVGAGIEPYPGSGQTRQQAYDTWVTNLGAMDYLRVYLNTTESTVANFPTTHPVPHELTDWASRGTVLSVKFDLAQLASGAYDTKITTLCTGYTGVFLKLAPYHEPEDDVERGSITASAWRAAVAHLVTVVNAAGNPKVKVWPVLMGYTWDPTSGRDPEDYWVPGVEGYAIDQYNFPSAKHNGSTWKNAAALMDAFTAWCDAKGVKKGWVEVGCAPDFTDATKRPNWIIDAVAYARAHAYSLFSWFDETGPKGDWQIRQAIHRTAYWPTVGDVSTQTITSQPADTTSPPAWRTATGK